MNNLPVISLLAVLLMTSCSGRNPFDKQRQDNGPVPVRTVVVSPSGHVDVMSYVGTAEASKSTWISSRHPGRLVSLDAVPGKVVREGDVLAVVESQSVRSAQEIARATLRQAQDGYDRVRKLHEAGSVADVKMVEVETGLAKAQAAVAAADKAMEECRIKAPFSGVIGEVWLDEGVTVDPMEKIFCLMDVSSVEVRFPVPENELSRLRVGDRATLSIPALDRDSVAAEVISKGISAHPLSHTYSCTLVPSSSVEGLLPGMVCKVHLEQRDGDRIVLPASVIRTDEGGRYVWTLEGNTVRRTYVSAGGFSGQGIIIESGLSEGDKVIVSGTQKVSTGMEVKEIEP